MPRRSPSSARSVTFKPSRRRVSSYGRYRGHKSTLDRRLYPGGVSTPPAGYRRRRAPSCCSCRDLTEPDTHWRRIRGTRRPDGSRRTQPDKSSWSSTGAVRPACSAVTARPGQRELLSARPPRCRQPPAKRECTSLLRRMTPRKSCFAPIFWWRDGEPRSRKPRSPTALRTTGAGLAPRGTERADAGPPRWAGRGSTHMTRGSVAGCRRERSQSA